MSTLLITGASGFIGGYLCRYFSERRYKVIATSRGFSEELRQALNQCRLVEMDVLDPSITDLGLQADFIIHAATANDVVSRNPGAGVELSVAGTRNILELAVKSGISKVLVFSTFQVYGTELVGVIDEATPPQPLNDYGLNHLFAEHYLEMYARQGKLQGAVVRPSNVYGRFAVPTVNRWTLVPACFCLEAFQHGAITLRSSGRQIRNFVSLENLSRACEAIIGEFPATFDIFNIASSTTLSILSVAEQTRQIYEELYNRPLALKIESDEPREVSSFSASLEKLQSIGFTEESEHDLDSEIRQIFKYLDEQKLYKENHKETLTCSRS